MASHCFAIDARDARALDQLGLTYSSLDRPADADKALALDPGNALAYYAAGVSMANQNKPKDALDYLKKADDAAKKDGDTDLATQVEAAIKRVGGK